MEINYQAGIEPVKVHPDLFELIAWLEHSLAPSSHLNISIGPLIPNLRNRFFRMHGFQTLKEIEAVLSLVGPAFIKLDPTSLSTVLLEKKE